MINFTYENFLNYGYIKAVLTEDQIKPIEDEINLIKINSNEIEKYNKNLAGNIKEEYKLIDCFSHVESLLLPLAESYLKTNNYQDLVNYHLSSVYDKQKKFQPQLKLENLWVNFQNKYEFNPIHNHSGVISFVIWIDIPFSNDDERKLDHTKNSNAPSAGKFFFMFTDILGRMKEHNIFADKKYNHGLLMFPAKLNHSVYPFYTSDKQRISVAGNFELSHAE